jgi:hypothetical protein
MNCIVAFFVGASALVVSTAAFADVAPDPCDGLNAGAACTLPNNKAGTCVDQGGYVTCIENSGTTTSSGTSSTGGSTTSATTGSGGSGGGDDDGGSSDEGCTSSSSSSSALPGLALVGLALGAFAAAGRRRGSRK